LVPDKILGVNLKPACDIHDYTYSKPSSIKDRATADKIFLKNMKSLAFKNSSFLRTVLNGVIHAYYFLVRMAGGLFYGDQ